MDILKKIEEFYWQFTGKRTIIGESFCKQPIYCFFIGEDKAEYTRVLTQYAMHAREWITALVALHHIDRGVQNGYAACIPCMNPDGVALATKGEDFFKSLPFEKQIFLKEVNNQQADFSLWKANVNAVDINVNFDADWGKGVSNVQYPAAENFIGNSPASELETKALVAMTKEFSPHATLSYHTKGEEIYWYYGQEGEFYRKNEALANVIAAATGYTPKKIFGSSGGYKDWCILREKILALTIEIGSNGWKHPITENYLVSLIEKNGDSLQQTIDFLNRERKEIL